MVCVGGIGIVLNYDTLYAVEPVVSLLILSFALKVIEVRNRRDVIVVIFLAYAVGASHFLFRQQLIDTVIILLALTLVTAALVALHQADGSHGVRRSVWTATKLLGQAAPLMIILFIAFPRISPLWGVPTASSTATTGPGETLSPGDVSRLAKSSELAFRVRFNGEIPETSKLYWRGLVLNVFDGRRWIRGAREFDRGFTGRGANTPIEYSVLMEPSRQRWLYALAMANPIDANIRVSRYATLSHRSRITNRFIWSAQSWLDYRMEPNISEQDIVAETSLPGNANPRARRYAKALRDRGLEPTEIVDSLLTTFNKDNFVYTLSPGKLGKDSVDEFFFDTRRGFCEHYASSFVFMLRAAGIPARIVVGYHGGEINEYENYVLVHQFDAHAWTEVWLAGYGWKRVDPTSAVAPARIELGMQDSWNEATAADGDSALDVLRWRTLPGVRWLRLRWDAMNYSWSQWVIGYNASRRYELLKRWLGDLTDWRVALFVCGGVSLALAALALLLLRPRRRALSHRIDKLYFDHTADAARLGFDRVAGEPPIAFAERIAAEAPMLALSARAIAAQYSKLRYGALSAMNLTDPTVRTAIAKLNGEIKAFKKEGSGRRRVPWRAPTLAKSTQSP